MAVDNDLSLAGRLLPRDAWMAAILFAVMAALDIAALADVGPVRPAAFFVMPGTLVLLYACFSLSLARAARRPAVTPAAMTAMRRFMGVTLATTGSVLTIAHAAIIAFMAGWVGPEGREHVLPLFMVGLSLSLMAMFNRMPKMVGPHSRYAGVTWPARWTWAIAWTGIICCVAMIVVSVTPNLEHRTAIFLAFAFTPNVLQLVVAGLCVWRRRRGA